MKILEVVKCFPKTLYVNFKVFPFKTAIKLPILVSNKLKIDNLYKGSIDIKAPISTFMIKFGIGGSAGIPCSGNEYLSINRNGKLIFKGKAQLSRGVSIRIDSGEISLGSNFYSNKNCFLWCSNKITIEDDVLIGWDVSFRDFDGHSIFYIKEGKAYNHSSEIKINKHVWIASKVSILKGVIIPENCIVAFNSCVTSKFMESNCILGGQPSKIIKKEVNWKK